VESVLGVEGNLVVLGAGGKMGPSLVMLAKRALTLAGSTANIVAVSRFSDTEVRRNLEAAGVTVHAADLADEEALAELPDADHVIYMVGSKFGTSGREHEAWAVNTFLPGLVVKRYRRSRIVAFSTGNIYPFVPIASGGSSESDTAGPIGEYAQSCLGRERVFEHASRHYGTPVLLFRLNYAIDLRYGVLLDVARAVQRGNPIDLHTGPVNVIWQGDANEMALRALAHCSSPPTALNITGPETISIRWLAHRFGECLGTAPMFIGQEQPTALLSNAAKAFGRFGYPRVTLAQMIAWTADWLGAGGPTLDKPTKFQQRDGNF
jgi:nucleoside-diphosphate-sugar epimerase